MRKVIFTVMILGLLPFDRPGRTEPSRDDDKDGRGGVVRFATLPADGPGHPEGIAADKKGNIYVATFDFTQPNVIYIFNARGKLETTIPLTGAAPLGMAFDKNGDLYVANFGGGNVLKFAPPFNSASIPTAVPVCAGPPACGLNAIAFDKSGDLYVSDSFGGNIFKVAGGSAAVFVNDELLKPGPHGFPPFGANGLAFSKDGAFLFAANTADDRILKIDAATKAVSTFAESVNGADGMLFDEKGLLWVAANQADEVVALDENGRVADRRGSFEGIGKDGAVKGLLFPASIVVSRGSLYVTNTSLPLTGGPSEPEADVTTFTVSRIPLGGH